MEIQKRNINFKSIRNPIRDFSLRTSVSPVYFSELDYSSKPKSKLLKELGTFFLDNFAATSSHPFWKKCRKKTPEFEKEVYDGFLQDCFIDVVKSKIKEPDTTIMIGRTKNKQISAAIFTDKLELTPFITDNDTLYVECLAVNKKYRANNLGKELLSRVTEEMKTRFNDIFLVAYNESAPFYLKQGYRFLENNKKQTQKIIESLGRERTDYPLYSSFLNKPLNPEKPRWYDLK